MVIELSNIQQTTKVRPRSATLITDTGGIVNRGKQAALGATAEAARGVAANARIQEQSALEQAQAFARIGQAVQNAGDAAFKIITAKRKEDEEREVNQGLISYANARNRLLLGEGGLYSLKGDEALRRSAEVADELSRIREEGAAKISTERGRNLYNASSSLKLVDDKKSIGRFHIQQKDVANKLTAAATMESAKSDIALNPGDETVRITSLAAARSAAISANRGQSQKIVDRAIQANQSEVIMSAINAAVKNDNPELGLDIFNMAGVKDSGLNEASWLANIPEIDGTIKAELSKTLREASTDKRARILTDLIQTTPLSVEGQLKEAKKIENTRVRGKVEKLLLLDARSAEYARALKEAEADRARLTVVDTNINKFINLRKNEVDTLKAIDKSRHKAEDKEALKIEARKIFAAASRSEAALRRKEEIANSKIALQEVDRITSKFATIGEQVKAAKKLTDLEVRDKVFTELYQRHTLQKADEAEKFKAAKKTVMELAVAGNSFPSIRKKAPAALNFYLSNGGRAENLANVVKGIASGNRFLSVTNGKTFWELIALSTKKKAEVNLDEVAPNLTLNEFKIIERNKITALDEIDSNENKSSVYTRATTLLTRAQPTRDVRGKPKKMLTPDQFKIMDAELKSWVRLSMKDNKKVPTDPEISSKIRELLAPISFDDYVWDLVPWTSTTRVGLSRRGMSNEQASTAIVANSFLERLDVSSGKTFLQKYTEFLEGKGINNPSETLIRKYAAANILGDTKRESRLISGAQRSQERKKK